ncbi:Sulfoxide reductase catalytic subunit YedY [Mycobacterium attenuatum]|uniref:Sulfoxide reductase catalytic subunit YedY n=2 Tax=Mycobacterium attenuatum TaxID=2341086 RepID=A0A498Q0X8_9MYCO|nr:Sulfoxide reductase catalytic subunit YedY [Mycobacterium attenuatum]
MRICDAEPKRWDLWWRPTELRTIGMPSGTKPMPVDWRRRGARRRGRALKLPGGWTTTGVMADDLSMAADATPEWGKRPDMIVHADVPYNAEPPVTELAGSDITSAAAFYVRNHGRVPAIAPAQWCLTVGGCVGNPLTLTYEQLVSDFPQHSVVATLACAGNRRAELLRVRSIPGKEPWQRGAISTAQWRGVRLADVLGAARTHVQDGLHVAFEAPDVASEARPVQTYGGSIPLGKAMSAEVLLAWQMNSEPLPAAHGGPVRVVVPGYIGARSVKWVSAVTVQPGPSENYFQALDYRILPPEADLRTTAAGEGISLSTLALNCDILHPVDGAEVGAGALAIRGYGIAGDGHGVARVDVSLDRGRTWRQAELHPAPSRWSWRPWSSIVEVEPGPLHVTARAWDDTGALQPQSPVSLWNPGGYGNNAWASTACTVR